LIVAARFSTTIEPDGLVSITMTVKLVPEREFLVVMESEKKPCAGHDSACRERSDHSGASQIDRYLSKHA